MSGGSQVGRYQKKHSPTCTNPYHHTWTDHQPSCVRKIVERNYYTTLHSFNGPFSGTTQVCRYQKGKTNLDFTEARDSEWQRHQLDHMQVCTSLQTDNHARTPPLSFLQAGCSSGRPTDSVKALKVKEDSWKKWTGQTISGGPYASLHLAPDKQPCQHHTTQFSTGRMPFLPTNQQRQSTEGNR